MRTQIWIAVAVYVLIAIIKKRLRLDHSLYTILQILSRTLFEKMPISSFVFGGRQLDALDASANQLELFPL